MKFDYSILNQLMYLWYYSSGSILKVSFVPLSFLE